MAQFSTNTMSQASAVVGNGDTKPNTWQGAGAAEFDLRSMAQLQVPLEAYTNTRVGYVTNVLMGSRRYDDQAYGIHARSDLPDYPS